MATTCVKCGYERQPSDTAPDYECPKCGVIYAKAEAAIASRHAEGSTPSEAAQRPAKRNGETAPQSVLSTDTRQCPKCKEEIHRDAVKCKHCGAKLSTSGSRLLGGVLSLALLSFGAWYLYGGGLHNEVARDFIKQYEITKRAGNPVEMCVQAGLVSAAYLQAHDQTNYGRWKAIEANDCAPVYGQTTSFKDRVPSAAAMEQKAICQKIGGTDPKFDNEKCMNDAGFKVNETEFRACLKAENTDTSECQKIFWVPK
jgi:predicted RNA-binding Zn-ribbon protein involved in translation (DUF1610 family)